MILVIWIFDVAKAWMCGQGLAGFSLLLGSRPDFPGHIPQVPVVHDVEDACKLGAVGVAIVNVIVDRMNRTPIRPKYTSV